MIYREPGFLAVVRFGSSPNPFSLPFPVGKLSLLHSVALCRRSSLLTEEGVGGRGGGRTRESQVLYKSLNTL